ncbi:serpentine type 7TM GPCR chemoreceptor str domain-containing protein [Ditylenchus destructor]|uniref:Serpentine type 7TM GPCR chemoreceptor str domain-containing protein n=1 Tax=Ditylenchus destructor TaxID=166010 RepID=A0AAD4N4R7_9BILA|nr:serpentine type 7TM GPCR chemoreceptor str domain-containing protein [Ditylenchus destructor]
MFVFYLLLYRSKGQFRIYSRILLISSSVDLAFTTFMVLLRPQGVVLQGRLYLLYGGSLSHLCQPWFTILAMFSLSTLTLHILIVPLQFVFRFLIVCRNYMLASRHICAILVLLGLITSFEGIWSAIVILHNNSYFEENLHILLTLYSNFSDNVPTFIVVSQNNSASWYHTGFIASIVVTSYVIIIYTATLTLSHLKSARKSMSQHTRHENLTCLLIVQAAIPLFLLFMPLLLLIATATIFPINLPYEFVSILSLTLANIPLANSLSTIFIVPNYRRIALGACLPLQSQPRIIHSSEVANVAAEGCKNIENTPINDL